ncbi:hypothetical protein JTE90_024639 [Oedothorax gibbosus]|uniref:Uncharacterized protein n=1 Tax=Oedothorax gibbosus TaxID=931172 RepID=A0AAV6U4D6_9ARAC|nr:hypothetical protein JTE90_024639 [Oedothorax gibbosus]
MFVWARKFEVSLFQRLHTKSNLANMNTKEKKGLSELLGDLSTQDLKDIANLTTNHLSSYDDNTKSSVVIDDIIKNAGNSSEILHRQKVSRDVLFKYLKKNGVTVKAKGRRQDYIRSCLNLWGVVNEKNTEDKRQTRSGRANVNKKSG